MTDAEAKEYLGTIGCVGEVKGRPDDGERWFRFWWPLHTDPQFREIRARKQCIYIYAKDSPDAPCPEPYLWLLNEFRDKNAQECIEQHVRAGIECPPECKRRQAREAFMAQWEADQAEYKAKREREAAPAPVAA